MFLHSICLNQPTPPFCCLTICVFPKKTIKPFGNIFKSLSIKNTWTWWCLQETGLPLTTCEVVLDRSVAESARARLVFHKIRTLLQIRGNRYEQLRLQAKELEANCKLISEAVESLIRIQSKNLDQQLFNKANEIQEEISRKRFDLRCAQIQLAGIRAQVYYN